MADLPEKIKAQVNFLLHEGNWTIDQVVEYLKEAGHPRSRSAVGRHKQHISQWSEKLKQSREITDTLVQEIGPAATDGKHGRLLAECVRSLVFDHLSKKVEDGEETDAQDFFFLSKALKELSQGIRHDQDFEDKLRQRIEAEQRRKVADEAATAATEHGLSEGTVEAIKSKILGVGGEDATGNE